MENEGISPWQFWTGLRFARIPLCLILDFSEIPRRMKVNKWELSETAFVHRMFDLTFTLRDEGMKRELMEEEKEVSDGFQTAFENLPWEVIPTHPHISELDSVEELLPLRVSAAKLDERLKKRTSMSLPSIIYRMRHGFPIFEPKKKHIKSAYEISGTRGASDS